MGYVSLSDRERAFANANEFATTITIAADPADDFLCATARFVTRPAGDSKLESPEYDPQYY